VVAIEETLAALKRQPAWLFPAGECPSDVASPQEMPVKYTGERCAPDARACLDECHRGDGNACYALALFVQQLHSDEVGEEALFLRACRLGIVSGCTNRAAYIVRVEPASDARLRCAARTFEMTCDREDPWGCTMLGELLSQGKGLPRNLDRALRVLRKGCTFGDSDPACQQAKLLEQQILEKRPPPGI
jgi:TPR repeat protein